MISHLDILLLLVMFHLWADHALMLIELRVLITRDVISLGSVRRVNLSKLKLDCGCKMEL